MVGNAPLPGLFFAVNKCAHAAFQIAFFDEVDRALRRDLTRIFERQGSNVDGLSIEAILAKDLVQHLCDSIGLPQRVKRRHRGHVSFFVPRILAICLSCSLVSSGRPVYSLKNAISSAELSVCSSRPNK